MKNIENKSDTLSVDNIENVSSSFEKPIKKKKLKKSKDNLTKPNDKLKTIETQKPMSKLPSVLFVTKNYFTFCN